MNRQSSAWLVLRLCLGVFFLFEGIGKIAWFKNPSILASQFVDWSRAVPPGSISQLYLQRLATPGTAVFARLVPIGEMVSGVALIAGFWTPLFAFIAFFMALNFHIASGALFKYSFLTSGYGPPVLGSTLALARARTRAGRGRG
jgi:uncharacterized membrane protein YphA (DoxX/SURF4 family)